MPATPFDLQMFVSLLRDKAFPPSVGRDLWRYMRGKDGRTLEWALESVTGYLYTWARMWYDTHAFKLVQPPPYSTRWDYCFGLGRSCFIDAHALDARPGACRCPDCAPGPQREPGSAAPPPLDQDDEEDDFVEEPAEAEPQSEFDRVFLDYFVGLHGEEVSRWRRLCVLNAAACPAASEPPPTSAAMQVAEHNVESSEGRALDEGRGAPLPDYGAAHESF